jgi:Flp pilus assembly protein protease CpaA
MLYLFCYGGFLGLLGGGGIALLWYLGKCFLILILFYPLFQIGALGAGDVKLLAICSGCLSGKTILGFLAFSMLIAACISLIKLYKENNWKERFYYFYAYLSQCVFGGKWELYATDEIRTKSGICLSGPILVSVLLHLGGVY